ncbi:MAG: cupin domain-containing protein [Thermosipho sp. (in: Bacteria)]|nr:cupin domain-containing protein [Thermosipho sp. (in: thermotogales)]
MEIKIKRPSKEELEKLGVKSWPIWTKEISEFNWYYDEKETCYFLEGEVEVETEEGTVYVIKKGDLVEFPKGLRCKWKVKSPVKKHYNFG